MRVSIRVQVGVGVMRLRVREKKRSKERQRRAGERERHLRLPEFLTYIRTFALPPTASRSNRVSLWSLASTRHTDAVSAI